MLLVSLQTAGVRGTITRYVTTISTASATYHFYELDVASLDQVWLECNERRREWVDYAEAIRRLAWKTELAQGLRASSLACWTTFSLSSLQNRIHLILASHLCHFGTYAIKTGTQKGYVVKHLPSMDIVRTSIFFTFFPILLYPLIDRLSYPKFLTSLIECLLAVCFFQVLDFLCTMS